MKSIKWYQIKSSCNTKYQVKRALVDAKVQRWKQRSGIKSSFRSKSQLRKASDDAKAQRWNHRSGIKSPFISKFQLKKALVMLKLKDKIREVMLNHHSIHSKDEVKRALVDAKNWR